ncbi:hypothetical protein [Arthrobacter sp. MA-N2]|uniref:hypothetical protein n=1 Tax=Arthrobacter sp. MA-N2 TaxID=1101188 RepID=UPI0012DCEFEA|nr:hypothetical protein [Arthrobacter sp. MA-N2]
MNAEVPPPELPLTLRQAAKWAGQDVMSFKALADSLNGTPADLRLSGNRGMARYDLGRLRRWLSDRGVPEESPGSDTVKITASWDGARWTVQDPERSISVTGPRLMAAQRSLARRLAQGFPIALDRIHFSVVFEAESPGAIAWTEAESLKVRADELLNKAGKLRVDAIGELVKEGMTPPEIAQVFGVSYQRIQQILANAKER